jgi:hypothetical protein
MRRECEPCGDEDLEADANKLLDEADALMTFTGASHLVRAGILVGLVRYRIVYEMGDGSERENVEGRLERIMRKLPAWDGPRGVYGERKWE